MPSVDFGGSSSKAVHLGDVDVDGGLALDPLEQALDLPEQVGLAASGLAALDESLGLLLNVVGLRAELLELVEGRVVDGHVVGLVDEIFHLLKGCSGLITGRDRMSVENTDQIRKEKDAPKRAVPSRSPSKRYLALCAPPGP